MRPILIAMFACCCGATAQAAPGDPPGYEIVVTVGIPVLSYSPAVAVVPEGDAKVGRLPGADMISSAEVRSRIGFLRSDAKLSMTETGGQNGPSVIGTHFRALIEPFRCTRDDELMLDLPWRNPCIGFGYAYRGDHNIMDQTFGKSVLVHALQAHLRVLSARKEAVTFGLWGEWVADGKEAAFILTKDTDAPACALEPVLARAGATARLSFWESGRFDIENALVFSQNGLASFRYSARYLHAFKIGVLDGDDVAMDFSVFVGAVVDGGVNIRHQHRVGSHEESFQLLVGMPIGG